MSNDFSQVSTQLLESQAPTALDIYFTLSFTNGKIQSPIFSRIIEIFDQLQMEFEASGLSFFFFFLTRSYKIMKTWWKCETPEWSAALDTTEYTKLTNQKVCFSVQTWSLQLLH